MTPHTQTLTLSHGHPPMSRSTKNPESFAGRVPAVSRLVRPQLWKQRRLLCVALLFSPAAIGTGLCQVADAKDIVRRAAEALGADWAADPTYACIERDETRKAGRSSSRTFEVLMIDGSDYHLPLAVDDEPLPPARHKVELIRLKTELERRTREGAAQRRARIEAWKKERNESGELLLDFPGSLDFDLLGEEVRDGHPAYAFAGKPRPGVVPATRAARVLTGVEGKAWVEKEKLHPIGVDFTVFKAVPVFGPLASVLPGTEIEIGMTQVDPDVWLIDRVSMRLSISKMHLVKSTAVTVSTYTQYKPNEAALNELLAESNP